MTKDQIKNMPIAGNAHDDRGIFDAIHEFAADDTNSFSDRAEMLMWMTTKVMGCEDDSADFESDQDLVQQYLNECGE